MKVIASCGGYVLSEGENRLVFAQRGGYAAGPLFAIGCFVAVAASMAGLGALGAAVHGSAPAPLPVLLFVIAAGAAWTAYRARRRAREAATPGLDGLYWTLQLDRLGQQLRDGAGRPLAPLHMVHVRRSFQALSSSRALEVAYPGNSVVVARGNPFVATVEDLAHALRVRGARVS